MIYDLLAGVYDKINAELDYSAWADFIEKIIADNYGKRAELILDLAAGTGKMTLELASRGYDMTAVDGSPEMLDRGRMEAQKRGLDGILWLLQDMRSFELYGTVDAVVCCLDSINHLTSPKDVKQCFSLVHNYLFPNGIFIFDVNAKGKFERIYADRTYAYDTEDSFCVWENYYDADRSVCDFLITLFKENADGTYDRFEECGRERMYTLRSLLSYLKQTGFELIGVYKDFAFSEGTDGDERLYIAAKCIKNTEET